MRAAVEQAIMAMRTRFYDRIKLREIASEVFVSPFHFTRVFAQETGVTPGRFLTSIRLFEAKRMLLTTSMTVSDIVCSVGYSSAGTFTKRFTKSVGLTPAQYRAPEVGALLFAVAPEFQQLPSLAELHRTGGFSVGVRTAAAGSIAVAVRFPAGAVPANIHIGAFGCSIPQNGPVAYAVRSHSGSAEVVLNNVPAGDWTVIAAAEPVDGPDRAGAGITTRRLPVRVIAGQVSNVVMRMAPVTPMDPPIAVTLASPAASGGMRGPARPHHALWPAA